MIGHFHAAPLAVLAGALLGCARGRTPSNPDAALPPRSVGEARAVTTGEAARFVFPPDPGAPFLPTAEDTARGDPGQGFIWSVSWEVPDGRLGIDPGGVEARGGLPPGLAGADTLAAVARAATGGHYLFCVECDTPVSQLIPNSAVAAAAVGGQVVLTVRGRDALRRLWPAGPPDSVDLFWRRPGAGRGELTLPLERAP